MGQYDNLTRGFSADWHGPALGAGYIARDAKGKEYVTGDLGTALGTPGQVGAGPSSPAVAGFSGLTGGGGSGRGEGSSFSGSNMPALDMDPAAGPDLGRLEALYGKVNRKKMIKKAMTSYDDLHAATEASGFQSAGNAGSVYANRMMQQGINPVASGVVAAQARIPVYKALAEINTEKNATRLDAVSRADALAANIAQSIASLQSTHAKTLNDFNLTQAGYNVDLSKFSKSQEFNYDELAARTALGYAGLNDGGGGAAGGAGGSGMSGGAGDYDPGYAPTFGPVSGGSGTRRWNQPLIGYGHGEFERR